MNAFSFYDKSTGTFFWCRFHGTEEHAKLNTPPGHIAIAGEFEAQSQRFDLELQQVVDFVPDRPGAGYEWDATKKRWLKRAEIQQAEADIETARGEIVRWEARAARPQRELLLGDESARPFLEEAQAAIRTARGRLQAAQVILDAAE